MHSVGLLSFYVSRLLQFHVSSVCDAANAMYEFVKHLKWLLKGGRYSQYVEICNIKSVDSKVNINIK